MMRRCAWLSVLVVVCSVGAGSPQSSRSAGPSRAACAWGKLSAQNDTVERAVLAAARSRFEHSLSRISQRASAAAGARFVTDLAAYVYGYPIVIVRRTILTFPRNLIVSIGKLADTRTQSVVAPNHDTLYSVGQIDTSAGPVVIQTPPTRNRYSVIQLLDGFTNVAAYLGQGASAITGESAAVVPPGWRGRLPGGMRVIRPATKLVWLLGRTLATGTADTASATTLLSHYSVTPLAAYLAGIRTPSLILHEFPHRVPVTVPAGTRFFDELGADLAADPPPARDDCALRAFGQAGVDVAKTPSVPPTGLDAQALVAAARAGKRVLAALVAGVHGEPSQVFNGWATTPPDTGRFGRDYLDRAIVAAIGLGANTNDIALYLTEVRDSAGRSLSGAHTYTVRFKPGRLPPVKAFWSLTLYNQRLLFYPNRLARYALGDRSAGLRRDPDGGLTIIVSHTPPSAVRRSNWLPAPSGRFSLYLRLYGPKPTVFKRRWMPPSIVRGSGG